ncbi:phosphohistidine phosphatase SixA [Ramlibacter solisilvae]|uniref:Phosphohistidine phosphatase n=1 Tax=Ramlibacter tataouinensis TaxID=94132 RepID=A0A127JYV1_9BURK|nr:histidine phosphatase family protein [Ramlibacter tataouinensis]AMO25013.1 phosphohistidine phosphatase [Ramlibacter tataouinensis]
MDLILWRHAEAEEGRTGLADLDRALTRRGEEQAKWMGAWLSRRLPDDTLVLCSPALRCQQTALRFERGFKLLEALAPGQSAASLMEAAQWPSAQRPVLVVGHQPTLGEAVAKLLRMQGSSCYIRKGAAWWLQSRDRGNGVQQAIVWAVQSPETARD